MYVHSTYAVRNIVYASYNETIVNETRLVNDVDVITSAAHAQMLRN